MSAFVKNHPHPIMLTFVYDGLESDKQYFVWFGNYLVLLESIVTVLLACMDVHLVWLLWWLFHSCFSHQTKYVVWFKYCIFIKLATVSLFVFNYKFLVFWKFNYIISQFLFLSIICAVSTTCFIEFLNRLNKSTCVQSWCSVLPKLW